MALRIKLRRDTAANWTAINPLLGMGEPGLEIDSSRMKIGDGTNTWNNLPYFSDFNDITTDLIPSSDVTYDLGSADKKWRDLYLSGNTIYLGDSTISVNAGKVEIKNENNQTVAITLESNSINDLGDVNISNSINGQVLTFNNGTWANIALPTGITDHGLLTGLGDDDHTLYALADGTRGNFAAANHTHNYIPTTDKGVANGVATLGGDGKVPSNQLPSYVDDVLEFSALGTFPVTGEAAKIYVTQDTNKIYRWSGSAYIEISAAAGTADTATRLTTARTISLDGDVTGSVSFDGSTNVTITATVGDDSHNHSTATTSTAGFMSAADKTKLDGVAAGANNYVLPAATASVLGGVKDGTGVTIDANGVVSVDYGSTAGTAVQGNDVRVTADQAAGTASIRTLGTGALQAAAGNHNHTIDSLSNVVITSNSDNEVLAWDSTTSKWINQTAAEAGLATSSHTHSATDVLPSNPFSVWPSTPAIFTAGPGSTTMQWVPGYLYSVVPEEWTKSAAIAATTSNLNATATSTTLTNAGTLAGLTIDGVSLYSSARVLVKNQTNPAHNGIYSVTNAGSGSVAWVLTRTTDAWLTGGIGYILCGAMVPVRQGTVNKGKLFFTNFSAFDTIGTTAMNWFELNAWSSITDKPTTLSGYGITDAASSTHIHSEYLQADLGANYLRSTPVAVAASDINCTLGNYFTKTINGNTTFTFSNAPASKAYGFTFELTHTSGTVTWPASVKWSKDIAPTLTTGKTHLFVFVTDDGGTRWRGAANVDYTN